MGYAYASSLGSVPSIPGAESPDDTARARTRSRHPGRGRQASPLSSRCGRGPPPAHPRIASLVVRWYHVKGVLSGTCAFAHQRCPMVDTRGGVSPAGRPRLGPERRSQETITSRVDRGSQRGLALDVVGVEWMQRDGEAVASGRDNSVQGRRPDPLRCRRQYSRIEVVTRRSKEFDFGRFASPRLLILPWLRTPG